MLKYVTQIIIIYTVKSVITIAAEIFMIYKNHKIFLKQNIFFKNTIFDFTNQNLYIEKVNLNTCCKS